MHKLVPVPGGLPGLYLSLIHILQLLEDTEASSFYDKTVLSANKASVVTKVTPSIASIDQDFSTRLSRCV